MKGKHRREDDITPKHGKEKPITSLNTERQGLMSRPVVKASPTTIPKERSNG